MTHTISRSHVAVAEGYYWMPIGADTPRGVKLQLLTQGGVAIYGVYTASTPSTSYTHWAPLPRKRDE